MESLAAGRYTPTERIAGGGMGEVWRYRDTSLDRDVAVKVLRPQMAEDPGFRARFEQEARHAAALHDPRIATVFDYGDEVDTATGRHTTYLVMELIEGKPLSELLTGPLPPDQAVHVLAQVADGLAVAHAAGIVHRDVKPANFLVTPDGRVKITDFGIARALGAASLTDTGTILGTPHYVAPEVSEGREATPASDIYSLGVVLYECLSGRRPFSGDTPVAIALAHMRNQPDPLPSDVPQGLRDLVSRAMAKDPAERPGSATEFATGLRGAGTGEGAHATALMPMAAEPSPSTAVLPVSSRSAASLPPSAGPDPEDRARRRTALWPLVGVAVAVIAIVAGAIALASGDGGDATSSDDAGRNGSRIAGGPAKSSAQEDPGATGQDGRGASAATQDTPTQDTPPQESEPPAETTPPEETTTTPEGVTVDPAEYIGDDAKEAEDELKALGLEVKKEQVDGDGDKDTVADVSPSGEVPAGSEVTLSVYRGKPDDDGDNGNDD